MTDDATLAGDQTRVNEQSPTSYREMVLTSLHGRSSNWCRGPTRYRVVVLTSWDRSKCVGIETRPTRYRVLVLTSSDRYTSDC
jgi:hypothetical protein